MQDLKHHFRQQKQKMQIHLEQLRVLHRSLHAAGKTTAKVEQQITYEEARLAVLEDLWHV